MPVYQVHPTLDCPDPPRAWPAASLAGWSSTCWQTVSCASAPVSGPGFPGAALPWAGSSSPSLAPQAPLVPPPSRSDHPCSVCYVGPPSLERAGAGPGPGTTRCLGPLARGTWSPDWCVSCGGHCVGWWMLGRGGLGFSGIPMGGW